MESKKLISREEAEATLKRWLKQNHFEFIAVFKVPKNFVGKASFGFLNVKANDRDASYPPCPEGYSYGRKLSFKLDIVDGIVDGHSYQLNLVLADDEDRKDNPYKLKISEILTIEQTDAVVPPKSFIEKTFSKTGENPKDAGSIARQLKLNELELYTHTKRFIFELIQNADDMPTGKNPVEIEVYLLENFFLFLHNGNYFTREDVGAICDAAKSTKVADIAKTGYKGIGFKSVFTDSRRVFIRSKDYSFKFDKTDPVFKDFWKLYAGYMQGMNQQRKDEFTSNHKGREVEFTDLSKIPWQIKPLWVEFNEYPEEIKQSEFTKRHSVNIALDIGKQTIEKKKYLHMIKSLVADPRFLLFLRNTRSLKFNSISGDYISIEIDKKDNNTRVSLNDKKVASYRTFNREIEISNHSFKKAGFDFQKKILKDDKFGFVDSTGDALESIPDKLGRLDSTVITFAAKIEDLNTIKPLSQDESILFNYLPTSDQRFGFPFIVNADFISQTNREGILSENIWNHYLFYFIGFSLAEWVSKVCTKVVRDNNGKAYFFTSTYLKLLPKQLLSEENEDLRDINKAFNDGLKKGLIEFSVILDHNTKPQNISAIIIDSTEVSRILGKRFFYAIASTDKKLPHRDIKSTDLKRRYLGIEEYGSDELVKDLTSDAGKINLKERLASLHQEDYAEFLKWFDKSIGNGLIKGQVNEIPFMLFGDQALSFNEANANLACLILNNNTIDISPLLQKIGFNCSNFNSDEYPNIATLLKVKIDYLHNNDKLFQKISSRSEVLKEPYDTRIKLSKFFLGLTGIGPEKVSDLSWFESKKGEDLYKLSELVGENLLPNWFSPYILLPEIKSILPAELTKKLISADSLFKSLLLDKSKFKVISESCPVEELPRFYSIITEYYKKNDDKELRGVNDIPWFYVPSKKSFLDTSKVFLPKSLQDLTLEQYKSITDIIESITNYVCPVYDSIILIDELSLSAIDGSIVENIGSQMALSNQNAKLFLDWCIKNRETKLLDAINIVPQQDSYLFTLAKKIQFYSDNDDIIEFISNSKRKDLYAYHDLGEIRDRCEKLGLLSGKDLVIELLKNFTIDIEMFPFVAAYDDLFQGFLKGLTLFELNTSKKYGSESPEHIFLKKVVKLHDSIPKLYNEVKAKIKIDSISLLDSNYSDQVTIQVSKKDEQDSFSANFKLSSLLTGKKLKSLDIDLVVDCFDEMPNHTKEELKIGVFALNTFDLDQIEQSLLAEKKDIDIIKLIFLTFRFFNANKKLEEPLPDILEKIDYGIPSDHLNTFLNYLFEYKFHSFITVLNTDWLVLKNRISEKEYALNTEALGEGLEDWVNNDIDKKNFLIKAGANGPNSNIVKLREGIKNREFTTVETKIVNLETSEVLNTLKWTRKNQSKIKLDEKILKKIYDKVPYSKGKKKQYIIPVYDKDGSSRSIALHKYDENSTYHIKGSWGDFENKIFEKIIAANEHVLLNINPFSFIENLISDSPTEEIDIDKLLSISEPFTNPFYQQWEQNQNVKIKIVSQKELPYKVSYDRFTLSNTSKDTYFFHEGVHYISESGIANIPGNLQIDSQLINKWYKDYHDFDHNKEEEKNFLLTPEEIKELESLISKPLTNNQLNNYWTLAAFRAIKMLQHEGYNLDTVIDNFDTAEREKKFSNIINSSGKKETVLIRSAIGGLLYYKYNAWVDLGKADTKLLVVTGRQESDYEIFLSQEEVSAQSNDSWVITLDGNDKLELLTGLIKGKAESNPYDYFSNLTLLIRLRNNDRKLDKIFNFKTQKGFNPDELQ